jgi:hypothetical protein
VLKGEGWMACGRNGKYFDLGDSGNAVELIPKKKEI